MAVNLPNLFTALGRLAGGNLDINALRGGSATTRVLSGAKFTTRRNNIFADFTTAGRQDQLTTLDSQLTAWTNAQVGWTSAMSQLAANLLISMVNADTALAQQTVPYALVELSKQMTNSADSVNQSSPSAAAASAVGSPVGNPIFVTSVKGGDGNNLQYIFPETLRIQCTNDAYGANTATARNEPLLVEGQAVVSDPFSYLWPGGSGTSVTLNAVDAVKSNGSAGNLAVNSGFDTFSNTNYPDNWVIVLGAATTNFIKETSTIYADGGGAALQFKGDGSTLLTLRQPFNTALSTSSGGGGSPQKLASRTSYAVNLFLRNDSNPAAGILRVALVDGSGTVINDDQGTANSFTVDLTTLGTAYVSKTGVFRLPTSVPSTVQLELKTTTAQTNARILYVDSCALTKMTQLYNAGTVGGGPFLSCFAGSTNLAKLDKWTLAISNTYGGFQQFFQQCFNMLGLNLQVPFSGSPTINDNLIT